MARSLEALGRTYLVREMDSRWTHKRIRCINFDFIIDYFCIANFVSDPGHTLTNGSPCQILGNYKFNFKKKEFIYTPFFKDIFSSNTLRFFPLDTLKILVQNFEEVRLGLLS